MKLTIEQAAKAINNLPQAQIKSTAVQGWMASAFAWSEKTNPSLSVSIEFSECPTWGQTFQLTIIAKHPSGRGMASIYLRLSIPSKSSLIKSRRISLKRTDYIDAKKVKDAMWRVKYNMTETIGGVH